MIIKTQSIIYINAQKPNPGFTSYFNMRYLDMFGLALRSHYQHWLLKIFLRTNQTYCVYLFQIFLRYESYHRGKCMGKYHQQSLHILNPLCQEEGTCISLSKSCPKIEPWAATIMISLPNN